MNKPLAAPDTPPASPPLVARTRLKVLSYNVHSCIGTDRKLDPERIAEVIAEVNPDIIGLQELDVGRMRTAGVDQAHTIASLLKMEFHFHPALRVQEEHYGDAILTALPARLIKAGDLRSTGEQRGALWVEVDVGDKKLQVFNTHLGLRGADRLNQIGELLGPSWINHPDAAGKPRILIGDFNSPPITATHKAIARQLTDAQRKTNGRNAATYPSRFPFMKIDHIFVSDGVDAVETTVVSTPLARRASDHLPLLATVDV
ncbi:endonuclease/exonuclease/phosphatase family protein [Rhizobium sp. NTR19]|uniref:Endonuclease/exonuclease/phosphatase family protein n=1 Tax=Neorhizobium turbinariae TaxID=2937795 RepID=A0ABT0ILV4_9HYPH|nr:endonuclease/exonuclease/phosphatase family protein [Neorhizobium turbinariae]MCK8778849.1 endonuclease/exonuclease/phosphatase family protein [Neorhizobium turbinariae]